ncbi:hypothetical protein BJY01DRAFT_247453 [Aspergillus pseudoustus]|uniref:Phosphoglycerate mutase family protein n=1 Tax=Aspergillus pseudoustus TaxID=1810923 RepID=A0ABR4K1Q1_9EURO
MYFAALTLLALSSTIVSVAAKPTVYLIRHGEKPADDDETGLSAQGEQRAQCLRQVFGASSGYDIGYIMAMTPKSSAFPPCLSSFLTHEPQKYMNSALLTLVLDGKRIRPYQTVLPLATDLGLEVDTSCDRDDPECVKDVVDGYDGEGNILICWEHDALTDIIDELGDDNAPEYPSDRFDLIWTDPSPYSEITAETSEQCPGLD